MASKNLEALRAFFDKSYEDNGYYVYTCTPARIAFAKKGNKFCDHWENVADLPEEARIVIASLFPAKPKAVKAPKAKAPAKRELKAAEPKSVKAGAWVVEGAVAKSPKGRAWKVTGSDEMGWFITSKSGLNGRLTKKGLWLQA